MRSFLLSLGHLSCEAEGMYHGDYEHTEAEVADCVNYIKIKSCGDPCEHLLKGKSHQKRLYRGIYRTEDKTV